MGEVTIEGVGRFPIVGDRPTPQEMEKIRRAIVTTFASKPPSQIREEEEARGRALASVESEEAGNSLVSQIRGPLLMAGGTAGAFAGGALGGAAGGIGSVPGAAAGGGLGTAAGSLASDAVIEILKRAKPGLELPGQFSEAGLDPEGRHIGRAVREGTADAAFTKVGSEVPFAVRQLFQRVKGVDEAGAELFESAARKGIPLGLEDTSRRGAITGARQVIGRFPFVSKPFRAASISKDVATRKALDRTIAAMGDSASLADAGIDANRASRQQFDWVRKETARRKDAFVAAAKESAAIVPGQRIREGASAFTRDLTSSRPGTAVKQRDGSFVIQPVKSPKIDKQISRFVRELEGVQDMSVEQFQRLSEDLSVHIGRASRDPKLATLAPKLMELKKTFELALDDLKGSPEATAKLRDFKRFYANMMKVFETPTAQKFGRTDRNIFGPGKFEPASANADELAEIAMRTKSPRAMRDLRRLLGQKSYDNVVNSRFAQVFDDASDGGTLNLGKLRKSLGLDTARGPVRETWAQAFKLTEGTVSLKEMDRMLQLAERTFGTEVPNVSLFVARRAMLSGARGAAGSVSPMAITSNAAKGNAVENLGQLVNVAVGTLLWISQTRRFGRFATDPKYVRAAIASMNPANGPEARTRAGLRLMRLLATELPADVTDEEVGIANESQGTNFPINTGPVAQAR